MNPKAIVGLFWVSQAVGIVISSALIAWGSSQKK